MSAAFTPVCGRAAARLSIFTASTGPSLVTGSPVNGDTSGPIVAAGRATGIGDAGVVVLRAAGLTGTAGLLASARAREVTMVATTIARAPSTPYARGCRRMPAGTQRPPRAKPCSLHVA